jgi:hypothetical protein
MESKQALQIVQRAPTGKCSVILDANQQVPLYKVPPEL